MSYEDYETSRRLQSIGMPFYALIMAAMRAADTTNICKLQHAWPEVWTELNARYNSPGGRLPEEKAHDGEHTIDGSRDQTPGGKLP